MTADDGGLDYMPEMAAIRAEFACRARKPSIRTAEIAAAEGINPSYVGRILRLTLLAPDLV